MIARALQTFAADGHDLAELSAELRQLAVKIQRIIPGYADAALIVVRDGPSLALRTSRERQTRSYRSSLVVGSVPELPSAQLLVRATDDGAFARLAEDFRGLVRSGSVRPPLVDLPLDDVSETAGGAVVAVNPADLSAMNQAAGALLDRGALPSETTDELDRIGRELAVSSSVAARLFLCGLAKHSWAQPVAPLGDS